MENFKVIYRILRYLEKAMDYDEPDMDQISASALGLTDKRWASLMEMLASKDYVTGISVKYSIGGDILVSMSNPRITLEGLEYLQENSMMRKVAGLAKGIADIIP